MHAESDILNRTGGRGVSDVVFDADTIARRVAQLGAEIT
jgi:hypothetical protein